VEEKKEREEKMGLGWGGPRESEEKVVNDITSTNNKKGGGRRGEGEVRPNQELRNKNQKLSAFSITHW